MKQFIFILTFLGCTVANGEVTVRKTDDGTARHCQTAEQRLDTEHSKQFHVSARNGVLLIRLVKCNGTNLILDPKPQTENHTWLDPLSGVSTDVQSSFSNYVLVFRDMQDGTLFNLDASELATSGHISVVIADLPQRPKRFRVHLGYRFEQTASNGFVLEPADELTGSYTIDLE